MSRVLAAAGAEFRIALRNRWVTIAVAMMALFAAVLSAAGSAPTGQLGADKLSVTVASLTSLAVYLVPLIALLMSFDAIAGESPYLLLDAMPQHSRVTVYGGLSQQPVQVNVASLIFEDKRVDGFWLPPWVGQKNLLQNFLIWRRAQKLMLSALKTEIRSRYPLSQVQQAIRDYESQMTGGKVLLVPEM